MLVETCCYSWYLRQAIAHPRVLSILLLVLALFGVDQGLLEVLGDDHLVI